MAGDINTIIGVKTLNTTELNAVKQNAVSVAAIGATVPPITTENKFTYFVGFDGTRNNRDNLVKFNDIQDTNVAQIERQVANATINQSNFAT